MRTAFVQQLVEEASHNEKVFLLVADLGFNVVEPFAQKFPNRFLNVGIAEQNMAGIAAGLAKEGFIPFMYSIGNFPTLRCMEQIRYDICYHKLNVNIVAVGGGYAYGPLGASHHTTEEIGMLRTIPNICVCAPSDPVESRKITGMAVEDASPFYIRLGKNGEPVIHTADVRLQKGTPLLLKDGKQIAVLAMGSVAMDSLDFVKRNNLSAAVYSLPIIKPMEKESLLALFKQYEKIITIEEHQASAGFGSAILECMNDLQEGKRLEKAPMVKRIAIPDTFTYIAGSSTFLKEKNHVTLKKEYFDTIT
ncbi:MAG: transketolase [Prevotellaceae bacterium]|jgi:transketolase|nr:transketolase [Prevotellaceae bacterium]